MRETSIPNKLNYKPQVHTRVCEENKEKELEEKLPVKIRILWLKDQFWKAVEEQ